MTVRIRGTLGQFRRFVRSAPIRYEASVKAGMNRGGLRGLRLLKTNISKGKVVDTGELRNSCEWDFHTMQLGVTAPHGAFMEVGTRPHMPPVEPLVEWAKRKFSPSRKKRQKPKKEGRKKGLGERLTKWAKRKLAAPRQKGAGSPRPKKLELTDKQARAIAWRVAMSIKKNGTKPRFYMRDTVYALKPLVLPEIRRAMVKGDRRAARRPAAGSVEAQLGAMRDAL